MLCSLEDTAKYARNQKEVAVPLAKAVVCHAQGDFSAAFEHLSPIFDRTKEVPFHILHSSFILISY